MLLPSTGRNPRQPVRPFVRGWEQVGAIDDYAASQLRDGELVDGETVTRYVTPGLPYLVMVERSQAKVGGQDAVTPISLRATMIMAREDGVGRLCIGTQTRSQLLGQPNQSFSSSPSRDGSGLPSASRQVELAAASFPEQVRDALGTKIPPTAASQRVPCVR